MSTTTTKPSKTALFKQKLREKIAHLRKTPLVTPEQKLLMKLSSLKTEAKELHDTISHHLLTQSKTFSSRAAHTPLPTVPPPTSRDPLFERRPDGDDGSPRPNNNYDAQILAHGILVEEWRRFEKEDVGKWEKRFERFERTVEGLKEREFEPEKAVGEVEHEFIGLDNAMGNLTALKGELDRVREDVELVIGGAGGGKEGGGGR